ncbi:hypothetical protein Tco_1260189 [Tanacetum coccineum]
MTGGDNVKEMASKFGKLDKFEGNDFRRWQKKMHFFFNKIKEHEICKGVVGSLESKYMEEDASSKKFLVNNFNNYKMVDSRPIMEQFNELLRILGNYAQHNLKMDESVYVSSVIDKLPHF